MGKENIEHNNLSVYELTRSIKNSADKIVSGKGYGKIYHLKHFLSSENLIFPEIDNNCLSAATRLDITFRERYYAEVFNPTMDSIIFENRLFINTYHPQKMSIFLSTEIAKDMFSVFSIHFKDSQPGDLFYAPRIHKHKRFKLKKHKRKSPEPNDLFCFNQALTTVKNIVRPEK